MTILNKAASNKSGLNEEPDGVEGAQKSEKPKGFTTKASLDRLEEDILTLLHAKEAIIRNEGYMLGIHFVLCL